MTQTQTAKRTLTKNETWILGYDSAILLGFESYEYSQRDFVDDVLEHHAAASIPENHLPTYRAGIRAFWHDCKHQ